MALREIYLQNIRQRKREVTYEEQVDNMQEPWIEFYEARGLPIRNLLAGRRWEGSFASSIQLIIMVHQVLLFIEEKENWTRHPYYVHLETCFAFTLRSCIEAIAKNLIWNVKVKPPVDRITFHRLILCYNYEQFYTYWTDEQRDQTKRFMSNIDFYFNTIDLRDQDTMRAMINANDMLTNV